MAQHSAPKNQFEKRIDRLDRWQQQSRFFGFCYAVIKKYGEDEGGLRCALLTYYGFLSLLPLLLAATTLTQLLLADYPLARSSVSESLYHYFPVLGEQVQANIHSFSQTGISLLIGILITLYGARGVVDILRRSLYAIWDVPKDRLPGFPAGTLRSLTIMLIGGLGILVSTVLSGYIIEGSNSLVLTLASLAIDAIGLWLVLMVVFKLSLARPIPYRHIWRGALVASIGLQVLHIIGGYVITRQLHNFTTLYGTFALVLGMFFWIYLQSQIIIYAAELDAVRQLRLWPRRINEPQSAPSNRRFVE